ncbi:MAG: hypothetical protein GEU99_04025 [Luteitalea sp.]|nr:hypothetical protein [Luteitalea sp.]
MRHTSTYQRSRGRAVQAALVSVLVLQITGALVPSSAQGAQGVPQPVEGSKGALPVLTGPVNDFAHVIDTGSARELDRLSRALLDATGDVIVVATIGTAKPQFADIRELAVELFENHGRGIGDKDKDNGLLVVLAVEDRQVWTEVGYGLEGPITDGFAGETSRLYMLPHFKRGEYGAGLVSGVQRYIARIAEERKVEVGGQPRTEPLPVREGPRIPWFFLAFVILSFVMRLARGITGLRSRRYRRGPWSGPWSGWPGGFGGGSWGGLGGGGGFGGGGFGGFGGGGSGGGGGGARW